MSDEVITHTYEPNGATKFVLVVAKEGVRTVDGREFAAGSLDWREPPIPLMMIRTNDPTGRGGHKGSEAIGMISKLWREDDEAGNGTIYGEGYFSSDEHGDEARLLIAEGTISGVSADVGGAVVEELEASDEFGVRRIFRRGSIVAVTALPIPAFDDTKVSVVQDEEAPILASASETWAPKAGWFTNQNLDKPTPITVTADGQIFGHAALWGTCHVGYRDRCVTPPHSKSNYSYFNVGTVVAAGGESVHVGRVTAGTGHAAIEFGAQPAKEHYDNTGWGAGYVHAGEDEHGIWFAGSLAPTATDEQIATLRASSVSGDWRAINGALELVGILAVNTPGFPVPRARAGIVAGAQVSLIASGLCGCENEELSEEAAPVEIVEVETVVDETPSDSDLALRLRKLDLEMWEVTGQDFAKGYGKKKACKGGDCGCEMHAMA
jgi:phage head maturation protease